MDERMKQRLVGAAVLVIAAVVFVPMVLDQAEPEPRLLPTPPAVTPEAPEPLPADADARAVPLATPPAAAPRPASAPPATPPAEREPVVRAAPPPPAEKPAVRTTPPPPKEPAAASGYAVQVGSFTKAANARGLRDKLVAKGYAAFVRDTGSVTRVYVGPQPSRAAAEKMRQKLEAEAKLTGIVVTLPG